MEIAQRIRRLGLVAGMVCFAALTTAAQAAGPKLLLTMEGWKEVMVEKDGKSVPQLVPAENTRAGDKLTYTITYVNAGDAAARGATLVGPVPDGTVYVPDSAQGEGAQVFYSINGGRDYHEPPLQYEVKKADGTTVKQEAPQEMYTHVRWVLTAPVPPGATGQVSYKVKVK